MQIALTDVSKYEFLLKSRLYWQNFSNYATFRQKYSLIMPDTDTIFEKKKTFGLNCGHCDVTNTVVCEQQ